MSSTWEVYGYNDGGSWSGIIGTGVQERKGKGMNIEQIRGKSDDSTLALDMR